MGSFEEGFRLMEEKFGNGRDNLIALATIAREHCDGGKVCPAVRTVDAYYEDGCFYSVVNAKSNKILQIAQNDEVAVSAYEEMFTAAGKGENLGWALDPKNAEIRTKLRSAFADWYDMANNENDENCCILAIYLTKGTLNINHWEKLYHLDFVKKTDMKDGGIF